MKKNTVFMIIGGVFVAFCLLCYLGPRTLEAFIDPPEPDRAPVDPNKYTSQKQYLLDRTASVIHKQKRGDNTALNPVLNIFRTANVVEAMTSNKFGMCEKIGVPKIDKDGSNCNGFCGYNDSKNSFSGSASGTSSTGTSTTSTGTSTTSTTSTPSTDAFTSNSNPAPAVTPPTYPSTSYNAASYMGNTDTVFIPPPIQQIQSLNAPVQANGAGTGGATDDRLQPYNEQAKCGVCPKPQPCPACARCPEPSFDCKKVPNYASTNSSHLPMPVLTDFSTFGM